MSDREHSWPAELADAPLRAAGFGDPAHFREGLARLRARDELRGALDQHVPELLHALAQSCDPDQAFNCLARWLEAGGAQAVAGGACWNADALRVLCALFAGTPALSECLIRLPARTWPVLKPVLDRRVSGGRGWRAHLRAALAGAETEAARLAGLRVARTEALLQIAALDLLGEAPLEDTLRALSDLADACLGAALDLAVARLRPTYGAAAPLLKAGPGAAPPPPLVIFALGKLGGRELNYSSDIDLVAAYAGAGPTRGGERDVEHREYFTRLMEEVLRLLSQTTEDGRVYRVDMRLRPYGDSGPLVASLEETLTYLHGEGRTWERQAWLKARPAAGDLDLGDAFLLEAAPFVYRRYLSLDAIGDMQGLKLQIESAVARQGETEEEVKLGRGGIRDIEFTVQFLQLMHGGAHPNVRGGHTLHALHALKRHKLLSPDEAETLERAYVFWRHVEHRLQLHGDLRTHRLPPDRAGRRRLARSLGFADVPAAVAQASCLPREVVPQPSTLDPQPTFSAPSPQPLSLPPTEHSSLNTHHCRPPPRLSAEELFEKERLSHAAKVRAVFEKLFAKLFPARQGPEGELSELLLVPEPDLEKLARPLPAFGLAPTRENAKELLDLARETSLLASPARTRRVFASLAPQLLKALAATGDPEAALRRFSRIAGSLGGKAIFYQSLHENPWLLKMTTELAAWSEYLTEVLVANPGLFDEVVDALRIGQEKTCAQMEAELATLAAGGDVADTLRAYRAGELLRLGVRDLFHNAPLEQTQRELSDLATALLRAQSARTCKEFAAERGWPNGPDGAPVGFAILAVGKFGGNELNYGSDLDVLFFYDPEGATPDGFPSGAYFTELGQALSRTMATPTTLGSLYTLDARLRPNGSKGPLASSLGAFERYWKDGDLADWERLALTRARFVAGDAGVGERAEHLIRSAVYSPLRTGNLAEEVRKMRAKMEAAGAPGDLKRGAGGIVDVEFLIQYLQLLHGPAYPPIRQTNTRAALAALLRYRKISESDGKALLEALEFLTRMANRVRIVHGLSASTLPPKPADLQKLALRAGYSDAPARPAGEALMADHRRHAAAVRALYEKLVV